MKIIAPQPRRLCRPIKRAIACGLLLLTSFLRPATASAFDWQDGCRPFIAPAELYYHLPRGLLGAMAVVESGRFGIPYPWALNIAGQSVMARDYRDAAKKLRDSNGLARRDIAIGCLQIHMAYHLAPFGAPEWALHPRYNVWYGAMFLHRLAAEYGDWPRAIAHYHASDPTAQRRYLCQIAAVLERGAPATRRALALPLCAY